MRRLASISLLVLALVLPALLACVGTPLPDPPSAHPEAMTLTQAPPDSVRLIGAAGAFDLDEAHPLGATLRVSNPRLDVRALAPIGVDGSFDVTIGGTLLDPLYLELAEPSPDDDRFLVAVGDDAGAVVAVDEGPDADGDTSPDAIDCAPGDEALVARACPVACVSDRDCDIGFVCDVGTCAVSCAPVPERCGNAMDDDCDGAVDEVDCL